MKTQCQFTNFFKQTYTLIGRYGMLLCTCLLLACQASHSPDTSRPNIVLIVADDLGYGDISCYGGEIETPHIDALAAEGIRFSRFHTMPMCAPTRAALLSGNDNHLAGVGAQGVTSDKFGYEGYLTNRIIPLPQLLKDAGYHTYMAGKWHLGMTPETNPHNKGFEHSFALLPGAGNHYTNQSVLGEGLSQYTEDGELTDWPKGAYSTDFYTDKLISFIDQDRKDGKPFFVFAAYTSPHWPLQVDSSHWHKFRGQYDAGYEALRKSRLASLKKAGMIPPEATLPPLHEKVNSWSALSDQQKRVEARKMELYAGMIDNLDTNIGRLIRYLKEQDLYDNTLFIFLSDNGAAYRDFIREERLAVLQEYYNEDFENMGKPTSYISYGPQWAEAGSAPFHFFKDYATEGGTNTTMILAGAGVARKGEISDEFTTLLDIAPTCYELAGAKYPEQYAGTPVYPLRGNSLIPYMKAKRNQIHGPEYIFALEHHGHAMLRKGNWKITNVKQPFDIENFALYNLAKDLGEQVDMRQAEPEKYQELLVDWDQFAKEIHLLPEPPGEL